MLKIRVILTIVLLTVTVSCTSSVEATKALTSAGYKNIKIDGYNWFGCGRDDGWHTGFTATGLDGFPVSGTVCSGIFKGATIRID